MSTVKLTDTHLVILSQAAKRPGGCVLPPPPNLKVKGGAMTSILKSLLRRSLVAEQPASRDQEEWRRDDNGVRLTLVIAPAGLSAIGIGADEAEVSTGNADNGAKSSATAHRDAVDGSIQHAAVGPAATSSSAGSKAAALTALIERERGATLPELMAASGWQAHSVRGFLSGTLKKKLGRTVISGRNGDGTRRYRAG